MVRCKNRIPYWIDWRLTGLAEPDYGATISFGLPIEPEDSQYGKYRSTGLPRLAVPLNESRDRGDREQQRPLGPIKGVLYFCVKGPQAITLP